MYFWSQFKQYRKNIFYVVRSFSLRKYRGKELLTDYTQFLKDGFVVKSLYHGHRYLRTCPLKIEFDGLEHKICEATASTEHKTL
jgi:hypothetical protein